MRRRKERRRAEEEPKSSKVEEMGVKLTEPEKTSKTIQHSEEPENIDNTKTFGAGTILAQIPRYVYLAAFFALLAGIFSPFIMHTALGPYVIQGIATLFLGLAGAILLFKAQTLDKRREIISAVGLALIAISLSLIFYLGDALHAKLQV